MRRSVFTILTFCFTVYGQQRPDFSGSWKMDMSRSESAHQDAPIGSVTLVIRQTPDSLSVETLRTAKKGAAGSAEKLLFRLDGSETVSTASSASPVTVKAHWEGPRLVTHTAREMNGSTITTDQIYSLGAGANELTIEKTLSVQHGYQGTGAERSTGRGTDVFVRTGSKRE